MRVLTAEAISTTLEHYSGKDNGNKPGYVVYSATYVAESGVGYLISRVVVNELNHQVVTAYTSTDLWGTASSYAWAECKEVI